KWHFQFTPNDGHDWDSTEDVVLVDRMWRGQNRKLLLHADRNGTFYVLDRTNGKFLSGMPFVYQNWNNGFDVSGRPIQVPGSNSSPEGSFFVYPSIGGATNFQAPSYGPITGWFCLAYLRVANNTSAHRRHMKPAGNTSDADELLLLRLRDPANRSRRRGSKRSIPRQAGQCGISSSPNPHSKTASWALRVAYCSRHRVTAISSHWTLRRAAPC